MENTITALKIAPLSIPEVVTIKNDAEAISAVVEGTLEIISPYSDNVGLVMNDEGKLNGMPLNRALYAPNGALCDVIAGTFLVVGIAGEDLCSLSDEQISTYQQLFYAPEVFAWINRKLVVIPTI